MVAVKNPPLDEIQWRSPQLIAQMGGIHSNTILFYFAESPFFERTSNNAVIMSQAMNNASMYHYIQTRDAFEARLSTMSGLEFIIGEEPAETGPGAGTGVWIVRKQTRRKRHQDVDEINVHACFFVVGENIYMAPTLVDVLASRIMSVSSSIVKALDAADGARSWHLSNGPKLPNTTRQDSVKRKMRTTEGTASPGDVSAKAAPELSITDEVPLIQVSEEAFLTHMRYGNEYINENPITGRPGDFHLSSSGRKPVLPPKLASESGIGTMSGPSLIAKSEDMKDARSERTSKTAATSKSRRRKSKVSNGPSPAQTPAAS